MSENKYYLFVNGEKVSVSKEIYEYDKHSSRKITYAEIDRKTERFKADQKMQTAKFIPCMEDSLDRLSEIGEQFEAKDSDFSDHTELRLDVRNALEQLSPEERELIYKLFFLCMTERELADEMGVYHNTIHKKKHLILNKLHKFLKN